MIDYYIGLLGFIVMGIVCINIIAIAFFFSAGYFVELVCYGYNCLEEKFYEWKKSTKAEKATEVIKRTSGKNG